MYLHANESKIHRYAGQVEAPADPTRGLFSPLPHILQLRMSEGLRGASNA